VAKNMTPFSIPERFPSASHDKPEYKASNHCRNCQHRCYDQPTVSVPPPPHFQEQFTLPKWDVSTNNNHLFSRGAYHMSSAPSVHSNRMYSSGGLVSKKRYMRS
jgi:hypothetical protein